jgi:hypothetical protein
VIQLTRTTLNLSGGRNVRSTKRRILVPIIAFIIALATLSMSACSLEELDNALAGMNSSSSSNNENYMTEDEVKSLIDEITKGLTVTGGDSYNISIDSTSDKNLLAASKGLLSAVSITSKFKIKNTYFSYYQGYYTTVEDASSAGAGVI